MEKNVLDIMPGWFYFSDGTFDADPDEAKTIEQVVAFVDSNAPQGQQILCFDLEETSLPFSLDSFVTHAMSSLNGQENCIKIATTGREKGYVTPEAAFCLRKGGFSGAINQLTKMYRNIDVINRSLERIGSPLINPKKFYGSSTEVDYCHRFVLRPSDGCVKCTNKLSNSRVRCIYIH